MPEVQAEIDQLKAEVAELTKRNEALEAAETNRLKKEYNHFRSHILQVVDKGDVLEKDFDNLIDQMETDDLYMKLIEMNNPSADVLGFRFIEVVQKLATDHLLGDLNNHDKIRLNHVIEDTIKPPFLQLLAQATPITHLISRVVSKVANFVKSVKGKGRSIVPSIDKAFDDAKIGAFKTALSKYVIFYDALLQATGNYKADVEKLKTHKEELILRLENYYANFLANLEIEASDQEKLDKVINRFPKDNNIDKNEAFLQVMANEANQQAYQISLKFPELKKRIHQFEIQYHTIMEEFFTQNLATLETATELAAKPKKLKDLKKDISKKITSLNKEIKELKNQFA